MAAKKIFLGLLHHNMDLIPDAADLYFHAYYEQYGWTSVEQVEKQLTYDTFRAYRYLPITFVAYERDLTVEENYAFMSGADDVYDEEDTAGDMERNVIGLAQLKIRERLKKYFPRFRLRIWDSEIHFQKSKNFDLSNSSRIS